MTAQEVNERSNAQYSCTLVDQAGNTVSSLTALTLSLINEATGAAINSRSAQDVLNKNNVTFSAGVVTWTIQPADNVIVSSRLTKERHTAIFQATWAAGTVTWTQDIDVIAIPTIV
jgi:hypothetical protein